MAVEGNASLVAVDGNLVEVNDGSVEANETGVAVNGNVIEVNARTVAVNASVVEFLINSTEFAKSCELLTLKTNVLSKSWIYICGWAMTVHLQLTQLGVKKGLHHDDSS